MNHIAHLLLAPHTGEGAIGTLLADFHRGPISPALPEGIAAAIALHRAIDSHTDRHPAVGDAKALFAAGLRRYAGVALDLYFDHCLARDWDRYATTPFAAFVGSSYERLTGGLDAPYVSDRMRRMAGAMRAGDWLGAYQDFAGVEQALGRLNLAIHYRFGREVDLLPLADELRRLQPRLDAAFGVLFPAVARRVQARATPRLGAR